MKFTLKGNLNKPNKKLLAFYDIIFDDCFVVKGFRLYESKDGTIHMMEPSVKDDFDESGYKKIAHPINKEFRLELVKAMLDDYEKLIKQRNQERGS